ncbi:hypothetical protein BTR22_14280 [Alkalihalophilus pseudofirmus]|uniref:hypothetical protein n=1 Tax=Alkalihalophilus pseudofirmus TaxID=79885 RepID=UPI0009523FC8|nr:hypothetical protein BTR22_14280 [Alkalihalophilus pseudofirmus]
MRFNPVFDYFRNRITSNSVRNFSYGIILYLLILTVIYFLPSTNSYTVYINSTSSEFIQSFIPVINQSLLYILPVSVAFFYFTYREQSSISSKRQNGFILFIYILNTVTFLLTGALVDYLITDFYNTFGYWHLMTTNLIAMWLFQFSVSILSLLLTINVSLISINTTKLLSKNNEQFKMTLDKLYLTSVEKEKYIETYFIMLKDQLETSYQGLEYTLKNGLTSAFEESFKNWGESMTLLMEETPLNETNQLIYIKKIFDQNPKQTLQIYESLIKNQSALIMLLIQRNKTSDIKDAITALENLEPKKMPELYYYFYRGIEDFCINIYSQDKYPVDDLLKMINRLRYKSPDNDSIKDKFGSALLHQTLFKKAVENNDVRALTSITYSLSILIKGDEKKANAPLSSSSTIRNMMQSFIKKQLKHTVKDIRHVVLFCYFQALLKSIEIGSYSSTGILIKKLTTDFTGSEIKLMLNEFHYNGYSLSQYLLNEFNTIKENDDIMQLDTNFSFNKQSVDYCLKKLYLLVYLQEKYIVANKLSFTEFYKKRHIFIDRNKFQIEYMNYIISKVENVGDKYGLRSVADADFFNASKHELLQPSYKHYLYRHSINKSL